VEQSFRFCPWCATPQRLKLVEFFRGHAVTERDRGKALRVSRYLGPEPAAVSLDERETARLRRFLGVPRALPKRRVFRRAAARPGA
jgi:hypothetical protein